MSNSLEEYKSEPYVPKKKADWETEYEKLVKIRDALGEKAMETAKLEKTVLREGVIQELELELGHALHGWYTDPYYCQKEMKSDTYKVFDVLVDNAFVYKCGEECRRALSGFASNTTASLDFLMWIVICSIPLCRKTPPEFQALLNLYLRVIYQFCTSGNISPLFRLDISMVRMITDLGRGLPKVDNYATNYLQLGANPITYIARNASITGERPNVKKPKVQPETEKIWRAVKGDDEESTFQQHLAGSADLDYRMVEFEQTTEDRDFIFDEHIANCLFQTLFSPSKNTELENAELLRDSINEAIKVNEREDAFDTYAEDIKRFIDIMEPTYLWVQYIRAYVDGADEKEIARRAKAIYCQAGFSTLTSTRAYETEMFCLFDSIHCIFKPKSLEHSLRAD